MAGVFGTYADQPHGIVDDGRQITITLQRTSPQTASLTWNIPVGVAGVTEGIAYNGIIVVMDTIAINQPQTPLDGNVYVGDPTGDPNLFAGDKIGTAFVVGTFYNDITTVSLNVTGLDPAKVYYFAGFAVDNVNRYHQEGVHTYSEKYGDQPLPPALPGWQRICLNVQPTDLTGLHTGTTYQLPLAINEPFRNPNREWVTSPGFDPNNIINTTFAVNGGRPPLQQITPNQIVVFDGGVALTWQALVDELNKQFKLMLCPTVGFNPPNTGVYYFDLTTRKLYLWNGYVLIQLTYISDLVAPTMPAIGDYWVNTITDQLYQWNGIIWVLINSIALPSDPTDIPCDTIWFDGTTAWKWDGTVWIPLITYIQSTDPEAAPVLTCGAYWFNTTNNTLYKWTDITGSCPNGANLIIGTWKSVSPILWPVDPTATLVIGDYWFDIKAVKVKQWNGLTWDLKTAFITDLTPLNPGIGDLWYDPVSEILSEWNGSAWIPIPIRVWDKDPANPPAGSVWWDTTNNLLFERDIINNTWVQVQTFYDQPIDPSLPLDLPQNGAAWFDPVTNIMKIWDGSQWVVTAYINYPTDPSVIVDGVYWNNTTTGQWFIRQGGVWVEIHPTFYPTEPTIPTLGEYWIDGSNQLYQWNGAVWVLLSYTTTNPAPTVGTLWFDSNTNNLYRWDGSKWVLAEGIAIAMLIPQSTTQDMCFSCPFPDQGCHPITNTVYDILIRTTATGARANIYIVPPSSPPVAMPFYVFDPNTGVSIATRIFVPFSGSDAPPHYPQYNELGIGTDGSSDERRDMIKRIFDYFGFPSVQIELTKPQIELCVTLALSELRRLASSAYQRKFFFLNVQPNKQRYVLTDICQKFDTIHRVTAIRRRTSSFLGQAEGQAVYGQLVIQQLYQMGTFDLVSYHIISDYIKMMEILFANRVTYLWDEKHHTLDLFQTFRQPEILIIDCACERTEQDIFADRFLTNWLFYWAVAEANTMLANIRGKFQTLPGAGGGVSLNVADLRTDAKEKKDRCLQELSDWVANSNIEDFGMEAEFVFG